MRRDGDKLRLKGEVKPITVIRGQAQVYYQPSSSGGKGDNLIFARTLRLFTIFMSIKVSLNSHHGSDSPPLEWVICSTYYVVSMSMSKLLDIWQYTNERGVLNFGPFPKNTQTPKPLSAVSGIVLSYL